MAKSYLRFLGLVVPGFDVEGLGASSFALA